MNSEIKLQELGSINEIEKENKFLFLPESWWYSNNSYSYFSQLKTTNLFILPFKKKASEIPLPKVNYWEIKQGDYRVKENSRRVINNRELKKKIEKAVAVTFLIATIVISIWISRFLCVL